MNSEIQNEITEKSAHETKCSNQKYILKLSSRLSFYIFIVLIENISQSFIVLEKCPEDEKIISCSSHQIPRMLQEYYRIALLTRKVAYHPQQVHTSNPSHLLHLWGTARCHEAFYCSRRFIPVFPEGLSHYPCDGGFTPKSDLFLNVYDCCPACKSVEIPSSFLILPARLFHKHSLEEVWVCNKSAL